MDQPKRLNVRVTIEYDFTLERGVKHVLHVKWWNHSLFQPSKYMMRTRTFDKIHNNVADCIKTLVTLNIQHIRIWCKISLSAGAPLQNTYGGTHISLCIMYGMLFKLN